MRHDFPMMRCLLLLLIACCKTQRFAIGVDKENNQITFSLQSEPPNLDKSLRIRPAARSWA